MARFVARLAALLTARRIAAELQRWVAASFPPRTPRGIGPEGGSRHRVGPFHGYAAAYGKGRRFHSRRLLFSDPVATPLPRAAQLRPGAGGTCCRAVMCWGTKRAKTVPLVGGCDPAMFDDFADLDWPKWIWLYLFPAASRGVATSSATRSPSSAVVIRRIVVPLTRAEACTRTSPRTAA